MRQSICFVCALLAAPIVGCVSGKGTADTKPQFPIGSTSGDTISNGTAPAATDQQTAKPSAPAR